MASKKLINQSVEQTREASARVKVCQHVRTKRLRNNAKAHTVLVTCEDCGHHWTEHE
jgi:DNA-directed RNA polymerase subunit M/transcription elongation factor TFIIS